MLERSGFQYSFNPNKCKECGGKCCTGESGYIFVSPKEIVEIAEFLGLDFESFSQNYIKKVGYRYSLLDVTQDHKTYSCIFFEDGICQIYPKRPKQCISFPFWDYYKDHFEELSKECIGVVKK